MLTLLISEPKQPGNDIDVYLQPLIDDLKLLWNEVEGVYNAYRGEYFKLKAVLFWTINDFPAYRNLSGSIVRGYNGCPICVDQTRPHRLKKCSKLVFMRHRRGLPRHHPYRRQATAFDNTVEEDLAPVPLTREKVLARVEGLNYEFGKREESTPRIRIVDDQDKPCWKKKSAFFQLEYWKDILVRHNLNVMHIEKNCCDSIIGMLLNIPGKTKDGVATRLDMVAMGIRTELLPDVSGKRTKLPLASWNLHLLREVTLCGPVFFWWMYPFERYMKVFKGWVRSRRHPEGCIAESYVVEEAVEFCAEGLLNDASTAGLPENSKPEVFHASIPLSAPTMILVYGKEMEQAHLCILKNTEDVGGFFSEHMELLKLLHPRFAKDEKWLNDKQNQTFSAWLKDRVSNELQNLGNTVSETIRWMSAEPNNEVATFSGYKVNGVEFYTKQRDNMRLVQNSGVCLAADVMLVSTAKDKNPRHDDMNFFGGIQHIWEVDYYKFRVPLFKCDWVENVRGIKAMTGSSTSSLNARALALRMKTRIFLRKCARSEVSNEEAYVAKASKPRRSPRSTRANESAQTSKDAPNKARVVQPRRIPRSTKATDVAQSSKDAPNNVSVGPTKATKFKKAVASKKLSFGSMSNSGSKKRKARKSKAGTMEVVDSDDNDEELDDDEDEEERDENVTGGLRLLRRGMVTMSRVNRQLVRGRKLRVKYNDDGELVGRAAKEMQSYIGVLARTKVPISVKDWRPVALSVKENIWGFVEEAYVVPKQWKKMVFASTCQKWREFKSKLTTWYIIPYLDSPELFEFPPDDYRMIDANQWIEFVKDRISPQFQVCKIQSVVIFDDEAFGYLKRVIVTPAVYQRLVEFLHFDIQSTEPKSHCVNICRDHRNALF
ncbi:hypothetical protein ACLB2K_072568 [Fragaria x ananassa]